ncbi:MAG: hypothetical protein ACI9MB_004309 [Verrucomicrobiales bacterium]|jgi:hypothetical protein
MKSVFTGTSHRLRNHFTSNNQDLEIRPTTGYNADVTDPRVTRCLPPGAGDIVLRSERGGHFARYMVSEKDFHHFLDGLWETNKDSSAHRREQMHGEGETVENAVQYYGPSKASGAMTTYYFDREAGIAYHDTAYW